MLYAKLAALAICCGHSFCQQRDVRQLDDQVVLEFYDKLHAFLLSMRRSDLDYCESGWDQ